MVKYNNADAIARLTHIEEDYQRAAQVCRTWGNELKTGYGEGAIISIRKRRAVLLAQLAANFEEEARLQADTIALVNV